MATSTVAERSAEITGACAIPGMRKACPHPVQLIERPAFSSVDLNDFMQSGQLNLIMRALINSPMRDFDTVKSCQQDANARCSLQSVYPQTVRSSMDTGQPPF